MKKKYLIPVIIIIAVIISGYMFTRFSVLKQKKVPENKHKAESIVDLRPTIIAKLQQLVKDGSDSLYNLNIGQIQPDVLDSKVDILNATLTPDTLVLKRLEATGKAPDDLFKITFHVLHVDGIGLQDLFMMKNINVNAIYVDKPDIKVWHTKRPYNERQREQDDKTTLYQKIMKKVSRIVVSKITVTNGTLAITDVNGRSTSQYQNVSFNMNDILVDSTTQYDKTRFLFARRAEIVTRNYLMRTPDSLYLFKCNSINIATANRTLTAKDLQFVPRRNKRDFQKGLKNSKDMYTLTIPKLVISNIDWWKLANKESYIAKQVDVYNANLEIYLDKGLPSAPMTKVNNFPHQELAYSKTPIQISKLNLHNTNISYEEYSPKIVEAGTVYFNKINAAVSNITNAKAQMKKAATTTVEGSVLFMKKAPMNVSLTFYLNKIKTGNYTADVRVGALDTALINPIAVPMGLFKVKSGKVQKATVHIDADNRTAKGRITMLYDDLKLTPLKEQKNSKGELKKKGLMGTVANIVFIKNSNPGKSGEVRAPDFIVERGQATTFFNVLWQAALTGILKTIGLPEKYAKQ